MSGTIPTGITSMIFESWKQKGKRISENTHTQTHTHTHIYIYIYIHTYIHTGKKIKPGNTHNLGKNMSQAA